MLKRMLHTAQTVPTESVEAEGTEIELHKTVKAPFKGLHVYGRSTQETTTGKQLASDDSITLTAPWKKEGKVYTGENSSYAPIWVNILGDFKAGEIFTISCNVIEENTKYYMNIADKNNQSNNSGNTKLKEKGIASATFTLDADTDKLVCSISGTSATSGILRISEIMVNKGSTPFPWEPYTGGIPSPNPDYPQEIVSTGNSGSIDVKVTGKNLWNKEYAADKNNWQKSTVQGYTGMIWMPIYVGKGNTVTVSFANIEDRLGFYMYVSWSGTSISYGVLYNNELIYNIKTMSVDNDYIYVMTYPDSFDKFVKYMNDTLQVEISSVATAYRPYTEQSLTVLTPNGLPGIPVTSGGNYTDSNGQQWVCDEVDFERGVHVQRIWKQVISMDNYVRDLGEQLFVFSIEKEQMIGYPKNTEAFCNIGYKYYQDIDKGEYGVCITANSVRVKIENVTNKDELAEYLENNPVEVMYAIATPIETPLSEEELSAYKALHSNYPTTIITNSEEAHMKVKCLKILGA